MRDYKIYFVLYGKKMVTTVKAKSKLEAAEIVKSKIIIHKVEDYTDPTIDFFNTLFNK
jgi:hypothetical protein